MLGFAYIFILVMILLGLDVLLWGTCLVLLGLGSVLIWSIAGPDHLAAASNAFDIAIGVVVFAVFFYAVFMLFVRPALRGLAVLAARHVPILRGYAPREVWVPRQPPSEQHGWMRWAYRHARDI